MEYWPVVATVVAVAGIVAAFVRLLRPGFSAQRVSNTLSDLEKAFDVERELRQQETASCEKRIEEVRSDLGNKVAKLEGQVELLTGHWAARVASLVVEEIKRQT